MSSSTVDIASLIANWAAVVVTLIGLSSLILQLYSFQHLFDPFYGCRGRDWLGPWATDGDQSSTTPSALTRLLLAPFALMKLRRDPPQGPELHATYTGGFCGINVLHLSRKPVSAKTGTASWTAILAIFHPNSLLPADASSASLGVPRARPTSPLATAHPPPPPPTPSALGSGVRRRSEKACIKVHAVAAPERSWRERLALHELVHHRNKVCTKITRTAFVTCLVVTNSYQLYKHSDASGLRAAYSGYCGRWEVQWPLGGFAEVEFFPLDSHGDGLDGHPRSFPRRVDKCLLMLVGMLDCPALGGKIAFPEPKDRGASVLRLLRRGFAAHGRPSHLFSMMGGNPYEVDFLVRRELDLDGGAGASDESNNKNDDDGDDYDHQRKDSGGSELEDGREIMSSHLCLSVPTPELDINRKPVQRWNKTQKHSLVYVPPAEQLVLATALDCLPWSELGWSVHRGMQCLLVAYGRRVRRAYRHAFVHTLRHAIETFPEVLEAAGWARRLVRDYMRDNSATALASSGDSGDNVRMITAAARVLARRSDAELDETRFWRSFVGRETIPSPAPDTLLDEDAVIALTKLFVLEWSNELDHNLYEELPLFMLFA